MNTLKTNKQGRFINDGKSELNLVVILFFLTTNNNNNKTKTN